MNFFTKYFQLFTVFYPIQLMALAGVIYTATTGFALIHLLLFVLGWILLCGLGSAVGLHRYASHKAVKLRRFMHKQLLVLAALCG